MVYTNREKRWPLALIIIGLVLAVSITIFFNNWEPDSQFSLWGYLFGLPIGIIVGYGWNLLIFSLALRLMSSISASWRGLKKPDEDRKWFFLFYLALLYIFIGEAYAQLIWDGSHYRVTLIPAMDQPWQIAAIVLPMTMIWLSSFALAYAELKWDRKKAAVMAAFQSIFTLLWIQPLLPYIMGRVG